MASVSLFQKWRSQGFDDIVGQEVVVKTLRNALESGHPAHAYLFCGPRGTGKTSTARIFAKALNCEHGPTPTPCNECSICKRITEGNCLDVLEIDAASHTQVEKIREFIVDNVHFAPAEARYKIYIIDEVHKLSQASFNALLKTLEEPPDHVIFILATTHPHELLPTILSRCQRHDFLRFTLPQIRGRIAYVAQQEHFSLDDQAAELLSRAADGSMRDALVGLEQAATFTDGNITGEAVTSLLGLAGVGAVGELVGAILASESATALELLDGLVASGRDLTRLASELLEYLRMLMLVCVKAVNSSYLGISQEFYEELQERAKLTNLNHIMSMMGALMELQSKIRDADKVRMLWEMTLIKLTVPESNSGTDGLVARVAKLEAMLAALKAGAGQVNNRGPVNRQSAQAPSPSSHNFAAPTFSPVTPVKSPRYPASSVQERAKTGTEVVSSRSFSSQSETKSNYNSATASQSGSASVTAAKLPNSAPRSAPTPVRQVSAKDLGWDTAPRRAAAEPQPSANSSHQTRPPVSEGKSASATPVVTASRPASAASTAQPQGAAVVSPVAQTHAPEAKLKYETPEDFWAAFLPFVKDHSVKLWAQLADVVCTEYDNRTVKAGISSENHYAYDNLIKARGEIEKMLHDRFALPLFFDLRLCDPEDITTPEALHEKLVKKAENIFGAQVISQF